MKITIEDLDEETFNRLALSHRMAEALWDFDQILRSHDKYGEHDKISVSKLRDEWRDNIYGINFDDIWS